MFVCLVFDCLVCLRLFYVLFACFAVACLQCVLFVCAAALSMCVPVLRVCFVFAWGRMCVVWLLLRKFVLVLLFVVCVCLLGL